MRVLYVYSGNLYGGVETILVTLARHRELCPAMEARFALCFEGRLSDELIAAGAIVYQLGNARISRPSSVWRARRSLAKLLRREQFDIVVCHSAWSQAVFGPTIRRAGLPLVFWLHDATDGRHWLERLARACPPDLALCNSEFTAAMLPRLYARVRAELIYCPVAMPAPRYSNRERVAARHELRTPEQATVIIQASRLEEWKGHALLLQALGALRDVPGWVCWLAGGGQRPHELAYLEELKRAAIRLRIDDRVRFLGERTDVPRLFAAADIHCQPNTGPEPFGITFVEALAAGLPVVTTAIGGAREIVDESCGLLVAPGDVKALAQALRRLIEDRALRESLGNAGPSRAQALCDPARQMTRLGNLLAGVVRREVAA